MQCVYVASQEIFRSAKIFASALRAISGAAHRFTARSLRVAAGSLTCDIVLATALQCI